MSEVKKNSNDEETNRLRESKKIPQQKEGRKEKGNTTRMEKNKQWV